MHKNQDAKPPPGDILIVDDETANLKMLKELLNLEGYQVRPTGHPQLAIDSALAQPPALILLDVKMPEMDGYEVCKRLKQDDRTRYIPIIFISALQDVQDKVKGFEAGGVDFISKPFQAEEVLARVRTHMELRNMQLNLEGMVAKRTAEALEGEERFGATFEQAAVGVAHVSPDGKFLRLNQKFCDIVGYSEEEMLALTFQDITHSDDLDVDLEYVRQVLAREIENYSMDKRYFRKDGSIVWVSLTVSLVFDKEGNPKYFVSVIQDISERKKAEEALRQSRDFLEHLISAVPDATFSVKLPERTINWANDSFDVLGYEPEEYIGQTTEKYYANSEYYAAVGRLQQEAIRKGDDMITTEVRVLRKDGRVIPAELTATYYREGGKLSQITAFVRDISERKLAEEKLVKSEAKYRSLVDNSMVGVFESTTDGRFTFANEAMVQMFDFDSPEQMIAHGSIELWNDIEDRERMLAELQKHGRVSSFEAEAVTRTGRHIHVLFSAKQIDDRISGMLMDISDRKQAEIELKEAYTEIEQLQIQLQAESEYLQEEIKLEHNFENIIGQSEALKYVLHRVEMVAPKDSTVILLGETGTGKELIARAIHQLSSRNKRPLMKVNCAALPGELIESELFGREKGAFTGATATQIGRFELADKSTLFLDEIGELPLELQAKLLRVLESGEFERLGSPRMLHSDARIITATNRDLEAEVRKKRFREDLWYRLKIFPITLPPLRDRTEDIPLLVDHFVQLFSRKMGKKAASLKITKSSMQALQSYPWPGNVRELMHVVESALIALKGDKLHFDLPRTADVATGKLKSFEEMEREYILEVLKAKNWKIEGEDSASSILGLPPSTLRSRIKKLGLKRP
ncbi:MAG: sigma 54-interacting transcriptional regulator [Anaerohalosphaeraceae bacterium]